MATAIRVSIALTDPALEQHLTSLLSGDRSLDILFEDDRDADVILTDHFDPLSGPSILIAGGTVVTPVADAEIRAVLPSTIDKDLLRAAIRVVAAGFTISEVDDEARGLPEGASRSDHRDDGDALLTGRESEVLLLLAQGATNKTIARELDISVHTVKFHVAAVLSRLGARNRSDAVAIGMRRGLVLL